MSADADISQFQVPFRVADVFGYLIPGATLLMAVGLFEYRLRLLSPPDSVYVPVERVFTTLGANAVQQPNYLFSGLYIFAVGICAYVIGHITSSISSLFIDRMLVFKGYGYPYQHLLCIPSDDAPRMTRYYGAFYRGTFFWCNLLLVVVHLWVRLDWLTLFLLCAVMFAGMVVATGFKWHAVFFAKAARARAKIKDSDLAGSEDASEAPFGERKHDMSRATRRWWFRYSWCYDKLGDVFTRITNTRTPLEPDVRKAYKEGFFAQFKMRPENAGSSNYWLSLCCITERSPEFQKLLMNWLRLYEFARNLSTAFYLACCYTTISIVMQRSVIRSQRDLVTLATPSLLLVLSLVMLGRYYYLYVCYYSKFLFRAFVYLSLRGVEPTVSVVGQGMSHAKAESALKIR